MAGHALYCTKFCEIISNGIKVIEQTQFLYWKLQRGIIPPKMQVEQLLLISAHRLIMLYISTKFCEIISNGIKVIEQTQFLYWKLQRGIIPQKMLVEWLLLISAPRLVMLYISTKFCDIITNGIKVIERTPFLYWKLEKGNNSEKNVGGVNIVNLCKSSGHVLYLCQVSWNYLERYQSYRADTISIWKITKGINSAKKCRGSNRC